MRFSRVDYCIGKLASNLDGVEGCKESWRRDGRTSCRVDGCGGQDSHVQRHPRRLGFPVHPGGGILLEEGEGLQCERHGDLTISWNQYASVLIEDQSIQRPP